MKFTSQLLSLAVAVQAQQDLEVEEPYTYTLPEFKDIQEQTSSLNNLMTNAPKCRSGYKIVNTDKNMQMTAQILIIDEDVNVETADCMMITMRGEHKDMFS
mgnify:CR=1 FL=1